MKLSKKTKQTYLYKKRRNKIREALLMVTVFLQKKIIDKKSRTQKGYLKKDIFKKDLSNSLFKKNSSMKEGMLSRLKRIRESNFFLFLFIVLILIWGYLLIYSRYFQVQSIEIYGNELVESGEVHQAVLSFMNGHRLWVLPQNNMFILNEPELKEVLKASYGFDGIKTGIDILRRSIRIDVLERPVHYLLEYNGTYYYADANGSVVKKIDEHAANLNTYPHIRYFVNDGEVSTQSSFIQNDILKMIDALIEGAYDRTDVTFLSFDIREPQNVTLDLLEGLVDEDIMEGDEKALDATSEPQDESSPSEKHDPLEITKEDIDLENYDIASSVRAKELFAQTDKGFEVRLGNPILYNDQAKRDNIIYNLITAYRSIKTDHIDIREYMDLRFKNRVYFK